MRREKLWKREPWACVLQVFRVFPHTSVSIAIDAKERKFLSLRERTGTKNFLGKRFPRHCRQVFLQSF